MRESGWERRCFTGNTFRIILISNFWNNYCAIFVFILLNRPSRRFAPVTPVSGAESAARHSQPRHLVLDRRMALMPRRACSESGSEKTRAHLGRELRRHHLYHFQDAMRGFDFPV